MTDENQDVDLHDDDEEIMEMKHGKKITSLFLFLLQVIVKLIKKESL